MNCSSALWSGLDLDAVVVPQLTEPTLDGQVSRLLDELPERFALAGLSLGGSVAMALARTAPERVSGLCLMSSNPYGPTEAQRAQWRRQRAALARGASARDLQEALLPKLLSAEVLDHRPDVVDLTLAMADELGAAVLDNQLSLQGTRVDERPGLAQRCGPTLVLAARNDALCSVERHLEMHRLVVGSRLVVVEQCAHLSPVERPADITAALDRWWSATR